MKKILISSMFLLGALYVGNIVLKDAVKNDNRQYCTQLADQMRVYPLMDPNADTVANCATYGVDLK